MICFTIDCIQCAMYICLCLFQVYYTLLMGKIPFELDKKETSPPPEILLKDGWEGQ